MKRFLKWFLGLAAVGSVIGLVIAYFCRDTEFDDIEEFDDFEEEEDDFDLDSDLQPASDRGYVPLKRAEADDNAAEENVEEEKAEEVEEEKAEESEEEKPAEEN